MESESVVVYTGLQNTRCPHEKEPLAIDIHEQVSHTTVSMLTSSPVSSPQRAWGCGDEAKCMCMYYMQEAPGVEYLIQSYPNFVAISEIPIERSTHNKVNDLLFLFINLTQSLLLLSQIRLCNTLYQQGLLKIKI